MRIALDVGPPDKIGKHSVSASRNGDDYPGQFNIYDDQQRIRWAKTVGAKFNLSDEEWGAIPGQLVELADAEEERIEQAISRRKPVETFTLGELVEKYPRLKSPVIHGFLREGEVGNLISVPKVGKSWGAYGLGISVVMGWDWLGKFEVEQGRVLLLDNELHKETLVQRIPKVAAAMSAAHGDFLTTDQLFADFHVMSLRGNLRTLEELGAEFDRRERGYFKLIIFDAKYRFALAGVSENDNASETLVANLLDQYAEKTGAALLLIHHSSKGSQSDKRVTDVGSGAGAQSRAADCHMVLREHEEEGLMVLDAAVRSFPPVEPVALRWEFPLWVPDDSVDVTALKGKKTKNDERQDERDKEARGKVIKCLMEGPATSSKVRDRTGLSRDRANRTFNKLIEEHQVEAKEIVIRGNQCLEYQLANTSQEDVVG